MWVLQHIFEADQQKRWMSRAAGEPTAHVLAPRSPGPFGGPTHQEIIDVLFERICVRNLPILSLKVVAGKHHIAWIADDVDHFGIAMVEILVRLDNARSGNSLQPQT